MSFSDYAGLKAATASWLIRDDLTSSIPDFITLCESRNNRRLRTREMITSITRTPDANSTITLPSDYIEAERVVASTDPITVLTPTSPDAAKHEFNFSSGWPRHYYIQGNSLIVCPVTTSDIVLDYYQKIPALSDSATTNWLLTKAPEIYLYGSLIESAPFMEDDNRLGTWIALYKSAVDELIQADTRARHGKAKARIRGTCP